MNTRLKPGNNFALHLSDTIAANINAMTGRQPCTIVSVTAGRVDVTLVGSTRPLQNIEYVGSKPSIGDTAEYQYLNGTRRVYTLGSSWRVAS